MSKFLADVLANDHPLFTYNLTLLEKAAGNDAVDAKLVADCLEKAHEVMRALGLDPADTHARELYGALASLSRDEPRMKELLGQTGFVLLPFDDGPISFNLQDVIENAHHELSFENRINGHGQRHLRLEIVRRYAELDHTDNNLIKRLAEEIGIHREQDSEHPKLIIENEKKGEDMEATGKGRILAIGDIFTDAFIKLSEDVVKVEKDENDKSWVSIPFGGRPPYEEVEIVQSVGPAPNAAVSCARLGLDVSLLSWLGDDVAGSESMQHLQNERVDTSLMSVKPGVKSNYYYVLRVGAERTILTKDEDYDYVWREPTSPPNWIYLASISEASEQLHEDMLAYLNEHPDVQLAFQPGTFHFKWGKDKLARVFKRASIVILNREEAVDLSGASYDSVRGLANALHALGPEKVVITDGPNGSYASYDYKFVTIPNYPDPAPPYDRTGAGDAFASTIIAALALGESMDTAMTWAPINSMSVVQKLGAQAGLLGKEEIEELLTQAPEDYKVTDFEG